MNEEKEDCYFVWERGQGENKGIFFKAAVYRGMPQTGTGSKWDNQRFPYKQILKPGEENEDMHVLKERYPLPKELV